jgi:hypothetical protein
MPIQASPAHRVLPCHRSPWTNTRIPCGIGSSCSRCSAASSNGEEPLTRRCAAKSTSASGRTRSGRSGRGVVATACSAAAATPDARSRATDAMVGIVLLPARTVISKAGRPAVSPARSTASSRGAASRCASANARAAASVASRWRLAVSGSPTRRTASTVWPLWSMPSRQGPAPARSPMTATTLALVPTWSAAHRSTDSIDPDTRTA